MPTVALKLFAFAYQTPASVHSCSGLLLAQIPDSFHQRHLELVSYRDDSPEYVDSRNVEWLGPINYLSPEVGKANSAQELEPRDRSVYDNMRRTPIAG